MSLFITSLNSGSNGNCYYIGNDKEAVLVDIGISCREVEKRMARLNLSLLKVKAIFISHEHTDHIKGVQVFSKKHQIPVYITDSTLNNSRLFLEKKLINSFIKYYPISIGALTITAFPKRHDAADPYSFIVEGNGIKIGVLTDIGSACNHVEENFRQCHAAFLEANYDEQLLNTGKPVPTLQPILPEVERDLQVFFLDSQGEMRISEEKGLFGIGVHITPFDKLLQERHLAMVDQPHRRSVLVKDIFGAVLLLPAVMV